MSSIWSNSEYQEMHKHGSKPMFTHMRLATCDMFVVDILSYTVHTLATCDRDKIAHVANLSHVAWWGWGYEGKWEGMGENLRKKVNILLCYAYYIGVIFLLINFKQYCWVPSSDQKHLICFVFCRKLVK